MSPVTPSTQPTAAAWTRQTQSEIDALFARQRDRDPFGLKLHTLFAGLYLFFAGWPTTYVDLAGAALLLCFVVRMLTHHRILGPLWWDPIARLTVALVAYTVLSRAWSAGNWHDWTGDAGSLRYAAAIPLLYPVLDRRRFLMFCLVAGLLCGQLSQVSHFIGVQTGLGMLAWNRFPDRISGWWDPVVGGSLLCAALGLHLSTLARAVASTPRGDDSPSTGRTERFPLLAATLALFTLLCILATGTRGAWIAAAGLIALWAIVVVWRATGPWRIRLLSAAATGLIIAVIVAIASPSVRLRAAEGYREVAGAIQRGDYASFTGERLAMWIWAGRCAAHNPILGVGAGGYRPWCERQLAAAAARPATDGDALGQLPAPHAHAHSWWLHTLATLGLVGVALWVALTLRAIVVEESRARRLAAPISTDLPSWWQILSPRSTTFAILGLCLAGLFDTVPVNQQTANMLFILLALSVSMRPTAHGTAEASANNPRS